MERIAKSVSDFAQTYDVASAAVSGRPYRSPLESQPGLRRRARALWKSLVDPLAALILLVALAPLFALITLMVWRQSGAPIFYGQKRWGQGGQMFTCWKFRTMAPDADALLQDLLDSNPEARAEWARFAKLRIDPRVTAIGGLLRRTSLDELPQLWNVIRGDMALVGARPIALGEERRWGDQFRYYLQEKPGVTGPWQVTYRNSADYRRRLVLQRHYLNNWTPIMDMKCLLRTLTVPFERKNAY
jgi:undecaprenyl-phosphate galactose phosphotransferase